MKFNAEQKQAVVAAKEKLLDAWDDIQDAIKELEAHNIKTLTKHVQQLSDKIKRLT